MSTVFRTIDGRIVPIKNGKQTDTVKAKVVKLKRPKGFVSSSAYYGTSKAFTIPNATCPKCGASVYYYEHPNGARVFFDSLGPPWPKHPCTTTMMAPQSKSNKKPMLENVGWEPLLIKDIVSSDTQEGYTVQAEATGTSDTFEIDVKPALMKQKKFKRKGIESLLLYGRPVGDNKAEIAVTSGLSDWIMFGRVKRDARQQHIKPTLRQNDVREPIQRLIDQKNKNISFTISTEEDLCVFTMDIDGQKYKFIEDSAKLVRKLRSADRSATSAWYRIAKSSKNYYVTIVNTSINYQKSKSFAPQTREEISSSSPTIKHIGYVKVKRIERINNSNQLTITGTLVERPLSISFKITELMKLTSLDKLFLEQSVIAVEAHGDSHLLRVRGTQLDVTSFVF
ncbi:hypothetical protein C9J48_13815 [Photobacterium profundum]|uniref:Uncharacterized protein n=1 Tax=Photobacterium profundum 3TCK TaxID=314280 RepID=Q1Z6C5_9GAMM|nr:hypothetical protein [Photobacterium profundum]EAS44222.1 hypothetical protein P3TCK_11083 [Photobacterium profundum 3TCK]PSV62049.1 hypothetical protein C9J48_13815 [Photobacterium profundum]